MKTKSELLRPRFKVLSAYPASPFVVGEIKEPGVSLYEGPTVIFYRAYPAIFKELHWFEYLAKEDWPGYVSFKGAQHKKVHQISHFAFFGPDLNWKFGLGARQSDFEPADKSDYLD